MTPQAALVELLTRVGAVQGAAALVSEVELSQWPAAAVAAMKAQRLICKAKPASSAVCPGCERECVMPVHVLADSGREPVAFVVCDKPSGINRVEVRLAQLEQWQTSPESIADLLASLLGLLRPGHSNGARWEIGLLKGVKHSAHVVLDIGRGLQLNIAGHTLALADVLELGDKGLALDRRALVRCVDAPVAGGGDVESAEQRRERLKARVNQERGKGTKDFLKVVAAEEGISVPRLKQLVYEKPEPANKWTAMLPKTSSKKTKPKS